MKLAASIDATCEHASIGTSGSRGSRAKVIEKREIECPRSAAVRDGAQLAVNTYPGVRLGRSGEIPIEKELKLSVSAEMQAKFMSGLPAEGSKKLFFRLLSTFRFAGFGIGSAQTVMNCDRYFDTSTGALETTGHCVRIRSGSGAAKLTVKLAGTPDLGVFSRPEYEAEIDPGEIDRLEKTGFDSIVRERFVEISGERLSEVLLIETLRHEANVSRGGELYKVCLDVSTFIEPRSSARSKESVEVEIEAQGETTVHDLAAVRHSITAIFPEFSLGQKTKQRRGTEFAIVYRGFASLFFP